MIKFLKKYKYVSLVAAALVVAVVSGAGGVFVYKKYNPRMSYKQWKEVSTIFNRVHKDLISHQLREENQALSEQLHPKKIYSVQDLERQIEAIPLHKRLLMVALKLPTKEHFDAYIRNKQK